MDRLAVIFGQTTLNFKSAIGEAATRAVGYRRFMHGIGANAQTHLIGGGFFATGLLFKVGQDRRLAAKARWDLFPESVSPQPGR